MNPSSAPRRLASAIRHRSRGFAGGARTGLRLSAAALVALLLGLPARPGLAGDPQLSLTVSQRWQLASSQGTWTPYVLTVKDDGPTAFTGDVYLVPNESRSVAPNTYPSYRVPMSVGRGLQRSVVVYVIDAPSGYQAELRDGAGRVLVRADLSPSSRGSSAVGILSDLPQAEQKIGAPLRSLSQVDSSLTRFASPQDFPTNAVYLSGLSGLVVDQFDSAALSQAQLQTLKDFVGLGGTIIEAGGPSWRRTLLSLPQELLPMRPGTTTTASLAPLAELANRTTDATAQVAVGPVSAGRVVLASPDGQPLVVEAPYGAGRVVELAFDPFAEPFDSQVALAGMAWAHAISRALSGVQGAGRAVVATGFGSVSAVSSSGSATAGPGSWAPGYTTGQDQLYSILADTPASSVPPVGLMGGLLVAYVMLVGILNYLFMKAVGRRALMWVTVPAVAILFTAGAYAVGFGTRGSDFLVTEVQVQRLAPEGTVQSYTFDGVYAPRNGDVNLTLPGNTLVSTAVALGAFGDSRNDAVITTGSRPEVTLGNVAVWNMRPVQTLTVTHPYAYEPKQSMPVDAQLRMQNGRILGRIVNLSSRTISDLELTSGNGGTSALAASLGPGASVNVNVDLDLGAAPASRAASRPVRGLSESSRQSMLRLAASQALSGRPGELALVGFAPTTDTIRVEGVAPGRSTGVAAIVEPVRLQSADSLANTAPRARLVSNYTGDSADASSQVDVYDFDLPSGLTRGVGLNYSLLDGGQAGIRSVEVFDWQNHSWRSLPRQQVSARAQGPAALTPGELAQGLVRVRVQEGMPGEAMLSLADQP